MVFIIWEEPLFQGYCLLFIFQREIQSFVIATVVMKVGQYDLMKATIPMKVVFKLIMLLFF